MRTPTARTRGRTRPSKRPPRGARAGGDARAPSGLAERAFRRVSAESLAVFRIAFGVIVLWEVERYLRYDAVTRYWIEPNFNFTYTLFSWLQPLPGLGMIWLFWGFGALAVLIAIGLFYRAAVALFALLFAYTFLLEESVYLNHLYLTVLLAFLMAFVPAARVWSLDARLFGAGRSRDAPAWTIWLLRFQVGVPYFFGGLAKLNPDWLRGEPIRAWLAGRTDFPLVGPLFAHAWMGYLFAYGGLLLDLLAVPLLLWRRTRTPTFALLTLFHLTNATLFSIGLFPWLMMAATTLFYAPDWPSAFRRALASRRVSSAAGGGAVAVAALAWAMLGSFQIVPMLTSLLTGAVLGWGFVATGRGEPGEADAPATPSPPARRVPRGLVIGALAAWVLVQVAFPLRHFLLPGRSSWTEEGHRFAWHMMLRSKEGSVLYLVRDPATGRQQEVDPAEILPDWQLRQMAEAPHMIHEFALYSRRRFEEAGFPDVEIRAVARASLNGRETQLMIDPGVDLAARPLPLWNADYIEPLKYPLRERAVARSAAEDAD